jgi:hypothetical protein
VSEFIVPEIVCSPMMTTASGAKHEVYKSAMKSNSPTELGRKFSKLDSKAKGKFITSRLRGITIISSDDDGCFGDGNLYIQFVR